MIQVLNWLSCTLEAVHSSQLADTCAEKQVHSYNIIVQEELNNLWSYMI